MPILTGSQNTTINGGHFTDQSAGVINNFSAVNGQTACNRDAIHDSSARDYAPRCLPGTRKQHIEDIIYWAVPAAGTNPLPLFRMKGLAGVGKSAIAQTCAERLNKLGRLGASFFFSMKGQGEAAELVPTITYQLCAQFPDYRDLVDQRIRRDKMVFNKTIATQFEALIAKPLQELEKVGKGIGQRVVIIIDGLDECEDADAQCKIIETIAATCASVTPLCWAFFSRPEPCIEATFSLACIARVTHMTVLPVSDDANSDIELYLRSSFENILRRRNIHVKSQWPSDNDIQTLVKASNGLFIYAATALRDVDQAGSLEEALRAVCATTSNGINNSPFAGLDAFYMHIMRRVPPEVLPSVLLLCRLLCYSRSYAGGTESGVMLCCNRLALSEIEFRVVSNHLSAVLHFRGHSDSFDLAQFNDIGRPFQYATPTQAVTELKSYVCARLGGSIHFYHKSFYDFLTDPTRSGTFYLWSSRMRNAYLKHCLEVTLKYEESYCLRGSAPDVPDSASSLSWPYTNELTNSVLKAIVYDWTFEDCFHFSSFPEIEPQSLERFGHADFRKARQNETMLYGGGLTNIQHRDYFGHARDIHRILLSRIPRDGFQRFDVIKFRAKIKRWKECRIAQPYYPNFASRFKSLIPKFQDKLISGLCRLGHGPKSIFWYWEINFESEYYQEFLATDLAKGERIYREQFDL
ncbi:hypothetical protein P691DRAFT_845089 [Macrolepiota fuliginosa MF-IS2]|uniref:Nephrocystin 3-like N-terminal domain-containing protein n=1 Tax=Macrolepiota fuliginosa MF-IS2 TaxID=1400762 RepID=A0A9P5XPP7_9AGAR|nr:hypothetical protein P691DRAFT_845089 [Macrolepiota fuliginosa MF-IS2]